MTIGERIHELRLKRGMTLEELGKFAKISRQTLSRYENSIITNIPSDMIEVLARVLRTSPAYLMGWEDVVPIETDDTTSGVRFLGDIAAGFDVVANEEYEYLRVPTEWLGGKPTSAFFALRVKGASMYPMFCEGDEILCLSTPDMGRSGRIGVIVYGEDEATLKRIVYKPGEDWLELVPINPEYAPRRIEGTDLEQCRVLGRVLRIIRTVDTL